MRKNILLWMLLCAALYSNAQTVTIVDQQTKEPIEGVVLISESPQISVVTNNEGQAEIEAFKESKEIHISYLGYVTLTKTYQELSAMNYKLELEQSSLGIDQVVVSATKWRQSSKNIPYKISTISSKDVALHNPQTAADLLALSGKVFIQKSQQGGGSPMIRGFATNRLIYTVDGVRMNTAIFRGGNIQNVINLDPFATESTEVLFGPGSVIYGSDAIGGVMSFQTFEPQLSLNDEVLISGKANARYSSANNENTGHFDINVGWKKWAFVTSFSSWDFDHLRQGSKGPEDYIKNKYVQRQDSADVVIMQDDPLLQVPSAYSQMNLMQKVRFKPNANWDLVYGFHYSTTSSYGRYDRHNRYRNGNLRYAEWNYGPQSWLMHNLSISNQSSTALYDQLNIRLALQKFEESRIDRSLNRLDRTTATENVDAYSVNIDLIKSTHEKNSIFYGVEYVLDDVRSTGTIENIESGESVTGPSRYPNASWMSMAIYVHDELKLSEKLNIQAGMRYNAFNLSADFTENIPYYPLPFNDAEINRSALTGSIGSVYRPAKSWAIRANIGTAFRAPNVDDIGKVFDSEPGAVTVPNPQLEAEYAYTFDLDVVKTFGNNLRLDIGGYYTLLNNALVRRNFQLNGEDSVMYDGVLSQVQAMQNAAQARVYGIHAGMELKLNAYFSLLSDLNVQKGEEELDNGEISPSRHAAPMFGVSRLRFNKEQLSLEINSYYQSKRSFEELAIDERSKDEIYAKDAAGNNYSPSWYTLNIKAMYQVNKSFTISSGIENLTDQRYRPYSSGISGAGRNFVFAVQANF